jgi:hypothetical protein
MPTTSRIPGFLKRLYGEGTSSAGAAGNPHHLVLEGFAPGWPSRHWRRWAPDESRAIAPGSFRTRNRCWRTCRCCSDHLAGRLSRIGSTQYSDDFRTGQTFCRGALMATRLMRYQVGSGEQRDPEALRGFSGR